MLFILDTETIGFPETMNISDETLNKAGFDSFDSAETIIQLAFLLCDTDLSIVDIFDDLCKPKLNIDPSASSIHHVVDEDLFDCPPFNKTLSAKTLYNSIKDNSNIYVMHNSPFDINVLKNSRVDLSSSLIIDTYKVAQYIFNSTSFDSGFGFVDRLSLQYLRYFLNFNSEVRNSIDSIKSIDNFSSKDFFPHEALTDCIVTLELLKLFINKFNLSLSDMINITSSNINLKYFPFGKDKGSLIENINSNSLNYWSKELDQNSDLKFTIDSLLNKSFDPSVLSFGKHKGKKLTQIPSSYLSWLLSSSSNLNPLLIENINKEIDRKNKFSNSSSESFSLSPDSDDLSDFF